MDRIAFKMLVGDPAKYLGLIFALVFSSLLMSQQISIFVGILSRTGSQIQDVTEADIWVMDPKVQYIDEIKAMPDRDLLRVRSVEGVEWAVPYFKGLGIVRSLSGIMQQVLVMGVDDTSLIGQPPKMLLGKWEDIRQPNAMIMDKAGFKFIWPHEEFDKDRIIELNDTRVKIVGICEASAPFVTFPVVYTRYSQALKLVPGERNRLSFILVKAQKNVDIQKLTQKIQSQTGLEALTKSDFHKRSMDYYLKRTGIPINFGITVLLGFIVGVAVAGQTFYIFIIENLKQFGVLKAIGVTNFQILRMVLLQALLVAFVGYGIGIGLCSAFFAYTSVHVEALRGFYLYPEVAGLILGAILFIILVASIFSIRRALVIDPAIVFRG